VDYLESRPKVVGNNPKSNSDIHGDSPRSNGDIHGDNPKSNDDCLAINLDPTTSTSVNLVIGIPKDLITIGERPYGEYMKW
jgi:hypothetical protein